MNSICNYNINILILKITYNCYVIILLYIYLLTPITVYDPTFIMVQY